MWKNTTFRPFHQGDLTKSMQNAPEPASCFLFDQTCPCWTEQEKEEEREEPNEEKKKESSRHVWRQKNSVLCCSRPVESRHLEVERRWWPPLVENHQSGARRWNKIYEHFAQSLLIIIHVLGGGKGAKKGECYLVTLTKKFGIVFVLDVLFRFVRRSYRSMVGANKLNHFELPSVRLFLNLKSIKQ